MFDISCDISFLFMIVPVPESTVHASFHIKLSIFFFPASVAFTRIRKCREQQLSFKIIVTFSRYVMRKVWIRVLWIFHFVVYFSSEEILEDLPKNNPTKKQIDDKIQKTLKNVPAGKLTEEKMCFPKMLLFELSSMIVTVILKYLFNSKVIKTIFTKSLKMCLFTVMLLFLRFRYGGFIVHFKQISCFNLFFLLSTYQFML